MFSIFAKVEEIGFKVCFSRFCSRKYLLSPVSDRNFVSFIILQRKQSASLSANLGDDTDRYKCDSTFSEQDNFLSVITSRFMQINLVKQKYPPKPLEFSPLKRHERQRRHQVNKKGCLDCFTAPVMIHRRQGSNGAKHRQ